MEQHTKKHARHSFYHLKNALAGLKIAMRGAFLNIKSMLALQIIYSIFYTLIEYSLFQLLLSIALKINELYNYKFDDTKSVLKKATKNDRYMFARSKYMGTYYAHQGVADREFSGDIRCVGACGETTYRKMFARAMNKNRQVDTKTY